MTPTCAWSEDDGCTNERVVGSKGKESYCREHKNLIARRFRNAGKGPEEVVELPCLNALCNETFMTSTWGPTRKYHSTECMATAEKAIRSVSRQARQEKRAHELAAMTEKLCPGLPGAPCGMIPVEEFYKVRGRYDTVCKEHRKLRQRRYDAAHPGTRLQGKRVSQMAARLAKMTYDGHPMTTADRDAELAKNAMCWICKKRPSTDTDHDHSTMEFRGMLCRRCNVRLHKDSDEDWLTAALNYLRSSELRSLRRQEELRTDPVPPPDPPILPA